MGGGGGGLREREGGEGGRHWEAVGISEGAGTGRGLKGIGVGLATAGQAGPGSAAAGGRARERGKRESFGRRITASADGNKGGVLAVAAGGQAETREARLRLVRGGERRLAWDGIPANADALMLSGSGQVTSLISLTKLCPVFVRPSRGQSGHLRTAGRGGGGVGAGVVVVAGGVRRSASAFWGVDRRWWWERKTMMRRPRDARRALLLGERQEGVRGVLVRNGVLVVILFSLFFPLVWCVVSTPLPGFGLQTDGAALTRHGD